MKSTLSVTYKILVLVQRMMTNVNIYSDYSMNTPIIQQIWSFKKIQHFLNINYGVVVAFTRAHLVNTIIPT